jgi:glycosyltransferase involved in cell wall biosynthesis
MKPWRLLIVSEPGKDGVFVFVRSLIHHLYNNHPEITVDLAYSSCRSGPGLPGLVGDVKRRGGEILDLRVDNSPGPMDFLALSGILGMVRRNRYGLIHAHSSKAGALVRVCSLLPFFPPTIYTPHAYYGMARAGGGKEALFNGVESVLGRAGITHNVSDDERDFAKDKLRIPIDRLMLIRNGIDTSFYVPAHQSRREECRRALNIPETGRLLVTVGRDSSQKNYGPLYRTLNTALHDGDWFFAHVGAGSTELRQSLSPQVARKCFAFPYLDDVRPVFHSADGFILTSRYEGLSLSLLYALSCGLPLILTDAPGFRFLKPLGFQGIRWLPNPEGCDISGHIETAVGDWAHQPFQHAAAQRALTIHHFQESIQLEELVGLYQNRLAKRSLDVLRTGENALPPRDVERSPSQAMENQLIIRE